MVDARLAWASDGGFRSIFENSAVGIAVVDLQGRYLLVNPAVCEIFGYSSDELVEQGFIDLTHPDDVARSRQVMGEVLASRGRRVQFSKRYVHRDGHTIWADVSSALIYDASGEPSHFITHVLDVTERRVAEIALAEERQRLSITLRSIGDGVITTDVGGTILTLNLAAEKLTGWAESEAAGRPLREVFRTRGRTTGEPCADPVGRVIASGHPVEIEPSTILLSRDGTEHEVADSASPIRDEHGVTSGVVVVFRDVTEKQRLIEAAQRAQRLESLGVLAGGIAHDFNNLLTGIYGNIEMARLADDPEDLDGYLAATQGTLARARGLTQQLLAFARKGALATRPGFLPDFLRQTVRFAASGSGIGVTYELPDDLWACDFDPTQLAQAVENIVINALQAMPQGGSLTIGGSNRSSGVHEAGLDRHVEISIADTGSGMTPEVLGHIFDPFYTTKSTGSGLGLAVAHSIVARHGGRIDVVSERGRGTTFTIVLPASRTEVAADEAAAAGTANGPSAAGAAGRILVMDDEPAILGLFRSMLSGLGYEVVTAADGAEALRIFAAERSTGRPFCAAIFDLTVKGGMGGLEAVARLRELDEDLPVFVATGYAGGSIVTDPGAHGFTGSVGKPFTRSELVALLETVRPSAG